MPRVLRILGLAFVLALTGAIAPGPVVALVIGQVLAQGIAAALLIVAGHGLIEAGLIVGFSVGLSRALSAPRVRGGASLIGGAVLLWMGWGMAKSAAGLTLSGAVAASLPWYALVLAGAGVSLANPYFLGWWATVGTGQVAALGLRSRLEYGTFYVGHELGDVIWYSFVAIVLVYGKGWLTDAAYRWLVWGCGAVLLLLGVVFLVRGLAFALSVSSD